MLKLTRDDIDDLLAGYTINVAHESGHESIIGPDDFADGDLNAIINGHEVNIWCGPIGMDW